MAPFQLAHFVFSFGKVLKRAKWKINMIMKLFQKLLVLPGAVPRTSPAPQGHQDPLQTGDFKLLWEDKQAVKVSEFQHLEVSSMVLSYPADPLQHCLHSWELQLHNEWQLLCGLLGIPPITRGVGIQPNLLLAISISLTHALYEGIQIVHGGHLCQCWHWSNGRLQQHLEHSLVLGLLLNDCLKSLLFFTE